MTAKLETVEPSDVIRDHIRELNDATRKEAEEATTEQGQAINARFEQLIADELVLEGTFGPDESYKTFKDFAKDSLKKISEKFEKTKKKQEETNKASKESVKEVNKEIQGQVAEKLAGLAIARDILTEKVEGIEQYQLPPLVGG